MGEFRFAICDVFTEHPLTGNQLAVFAQGHGIPEALLQPLAREINFSETVYVYPPRSGGHARIRIFTPGRELPFAGHPVLGTAFVVAAPLTLREIILETGAGPILVELQWEGPRIRFGRMAQPPPPIEPFGSEAELLKALGVGRSELPVEMYVNGPRHVYVKLASEAEVARLAPDLGALGRLPHACFNCFAGAGRRWKTRVFAPAYGIPEDPASGSAAGPLAWHLARHGLIAFGEEIEIAQGVEVGRPSTLYARVRGSRDRIDGVEVGGAAVVVGGGTFRFETEAGHPLSRSSR